MISKRKIITWKKDREKRKGERNDPAWLLGVQTAAGKIATLAKLAREALFVNVFPVCFPANKEKKGAVVFISSFP